MRFTNDVIQVVSPRTVLDNADEDHRITVHATSSRAIDVFTVRFCVRNAADSVDLLLPIS